MSTRRVTIPAAGTRLNKNGGTDLEMMPDTGLLVIAGRTFAGSRIEKHMVSYERNGTVIVDITSDDEAWLDAVEIALTSADIGALRTTYMGRTFRDDEPVR